MTAATKQAIETALTAHLEDEGMLRDGELVTDWLLIAASLPRERTEDEDAIYLVVTPDHTMAHHTLGLAAWYMFDRRDEDRRQ